MCGENLVLWCCALLLFVSSSEPLRNFINDKIHANSIKNRDDKTEFIRNDDRKDDDLLQDKFYFFKFPEKSNEMSMESQANFIKIDNKDNSTYGNNNINIVPYEMCENVTCIQLCCPFGDHLVNNSCIPGTDEYDFPQVYDDSDELENKHKTINELFQLIVRDPCQETEHSQLDLDYFSSDQQYMFLANGSLYFSDLEIFLEPTSYCLAVVNDSQFEAIICSETMGKINEILFNKIMFVYEIFDMIINELYIILWSTHIVSMLCLLTMFLVYSILPELRNIQSFMLRRYSSMSFISNAIDIMQYEMLIQQNEKNFICITGAFVMYFCNLARSFWLSVMSFDMWWTFRDFRSLQRNVKRQEKKKLVYSIFAWGGPSIFTIICLIMDFVPNIPENLIRPGLIDNCWFDDGAAFRLYFYWPNSICVIGSICLSIYIALKIARYENDTTRHLKNSESRCYNDNKQWFKLYLKLFIMLFILMAINWIIRTTWEFWEVNMTNVKSKLHVAYSLFFMDTLQNVGIFIIFVCKKTIMRLLLKRFCQNHRSVSKISTHSGSYRLEQLHHRVNDNCSTETYQLRESK